MYTDITLWPNQVANPVNNVNDLILINVNDYLNGVTCLVKSLGSLFYYDKDSVLANDDESVIMPISGVGRWLFVNQNNVFNPITVNGTAKSIGATINSLYYLSGTGSNTTLTLPQTFKAGNKIQIINQITTNSVIIKPGVYASQEIISGSSTTSNIPGGQVSSAQRGCVMNLVGVVDNSTWFIEVIPQFGSTASAAVSFV